LEEELRVLRNNYEAHISAAQKNSQNEQFQAIIYLFTLIQSIFDKIHLVHGKFRPGAID
jgi:hypothetical protein